MTIIIILLYFTGLGILLMFSSFFSGSETALTALTRTQIQRIREDGKKSSVAIIKFLDEPKRLFITVLFGNTLVNMAFVSVTGSLIYVQLFKGRSVGLAYIVAILTQTVLLLLFGEITPKTYAIHHSESFSRTVARPLWVFSHLIYPFRRALRILTDFLLPLFGVHSVIDQTPITSDEIRAIVKASEEYGALDKEEGEIIYNIFDLHDITAKEAMVPRTEMVCVEVSKTIQEVFDMTKKVGHSRLPVYRKKIDSICGIFYVKDMPRWRGLKIESLGGRRIEQLTIEEFLSSSEMLNELNPGNESTLIQQPFFIFETKKIGGLMREMTREKKQMAILLDEYGGVSGLITVEDIVEEVLGEIFDEYDTVSALTITRDPNDPSSMLIPGFVSIRSVNKRLKSKLDVSMADTIGGYVVRLFGSIPDKGDVVADRAKGLKFEVLQMDGKRIGLLRLRRIRDKQDKKSRSVKLAFLFLLLLGIFSMGASTGGNATQADSWFPVFIFSFVFIFALVLGAFYNGSETAIVSASKAKIDILAQENNFRALFIKKLWQEPDKMLGIVLAGTNLMAAAAGAAGLRLTVYAFPGREGLQQLINTIVMTFLILVFCEIIPKTTFRAKADSLALRSAPGLQISDFLLRPLVNLMIKITNSIVRIAGREDSRERLHRMREELRLLARMGAKGGALKKEQIRMIHSVLDLETVTLEKVMTPLVDIVALPKKTSLDDFYRIISETGFSRIPVYEERVDNIVGVVNVLDVLYSEKTAATIAPFIRRDIRYEPESRRVYPLLRELKSSQNPMVFVLDEYGGIIGLVTIEDLIEEILGDIRDEKDREVEGVIHQISDRIIECDGKTEIQSINKFYGMLIPVGDYNTIAGYVISLMERIPKRGEFIETDKLKVVVLDADSRSIRRVRIQKK
jgi:putative hemolysin